MQSNQVKVATARTALNRLLESQRGQIAAALPQHFTPERMIRLTLTEFSKNPKLAECKAESILSCVIIASQLGLEIGVQGQAYLVPYKDSCTLVPGWQGLLELIHRSGKSSAQTGAVYEGDLFDYELGSTPFIKHKPCGENAVNKLTHVYAVGHLLSGGPPIIEIWPIRKVLSHRDQYNKVGSSHYSFTHLEMYARKVALLQVIKYLPKSVEMQNAIKLDNAATNGELGNWINGEFTVETQPEPDPVHTPSPNGPDPIRNSPLRSEAVDVTTGEVTEVDESEIKTGSPAFQTLNNMLLKTRETDAAKNLLQHELAKKMTQQERSQFAAKVQLHLDALEAGMGV